MSIATAIQNAQTKVENAYTAVSTKGGTLPATQDLSHLPTAITSIPGAVAPTINTLNVTPSTSAQTITATGGVDGYSPVNVSAVTSAIDANITAGNIKNGITILGITGNYSGTVPSGTLNITSNGTYNVTNYATAEVSVSGASGPSISRSIDANGELQLGSTFMDTTGIVTIGTKSSYGVGEDEVGVLERAYYGNRSLAGPIAFSDLEELSNGRSCRETFAYCPYITTVAFPSLTTITTDYAGVSPCEGMFKNSGVTSVDLSALTEIDANGAPASSEGMFENCTSLTSVNLSSLQQISGDCRYMFKNCSNLATINLTSLTDFSDYADCTSMFEGCTSLTSASFLSNISSFAGNFEKMFYGCTGLTGAIAFSSLSDGGEYATTYQMFKGCTGITSADLSSFTSISASAFESMFEGCTSLTTVDISNVTVAYEGVGSSYGNRMFYGCTSLTSADLRSLRTVNQYGCSNMFYGCTNLTTVNVSGIQTINSNGCSAMFQECSSLTSVTFTSLSNMSGSSQALASAFRNCTSLQHVYFPAISTSSFGSKSNQFSSMLYGCTGVTLHFRAGTDYQVGNLTGYPNFGGTNITVLFDL